MTGPGGRATAPGPAGRPARLWSPALGMTVVHPGDGRAGKLPLGAIDCLQQSCVGTGGNSAGEGGGRRVQWRAVVNMFRLGKVTCFFHQTRVILALGVICLVVMH